MAPARSLHRRVLVLAASMTLVSTQALAATRSLRTEEAPAQPLPASTVAIASSSGSLATGQCLGVVVAPFAVIASTECLEHELHVFSQHSSRLSVRSTRDERSEVQVMGLAHGSSVHTGGSISLLTLKRPLQDVTPALLQTTTTSEHTTHDALHVGTLESRSSTPRGLLARSACDSQFTRLQNNSKWDAADWLCVDSGLAAVSSTCDASTSTTEKTTKWVSDGFLFGQDPQTGHDVLWGLVWTSATKCDADSVGAPASTPVNTVHAVQKLLIAHAYGHRWTTSTATTPPPRKFKGDEPPGNTSSHSGSTEDEVGEEGDSTRDVGSGSTGGQGDVSGPPSSSMPPPSPSPSLSPPRPRAPVPSWLGELYSTAALLTPTNDTRRLDDTTSLALFLTPRHLVVPRLWLRGNNESTIQWATATDGTQFKVTKITSEAEFYSDSPTKLAAARDAQLDLLVVEIELPERRNATERAPESKPDTTENSPDDAILPVLDRIPDDNQPDMTVETYEDTYEGTPLRTPILARPPTQHAAYEGVVITLADRALLLEQARPRELSHSGDASGPTDSEDDEQVHADYLDGVVRFVDADQCGRLANGRNDDVSEFLCANATMISSTGSVWTTSSDAPSTMGILQEGGVFVGFTLASPVASHTFAVMRLAAPIHRAFLEAATDNQVEWVTRDAFGEDERRVASYASYAATLYTIDDAGDVTGICSGLLIAPRFVLTMASCLLRVEHVTTVGLTKQWGSERLYAARSDRQVTHPLYKTRDDFGVDLAVVELAEPVLDIEPVALNPGYPAWTVNVTVQEAPNGLAARETMDGDIDQRPLVPPVLIECEADPHMRRDSSRSSRGKSGFHLRGLCVKPGTGKVRFTQPPPPGTPLITTTSFGTLTASGFSVRVSTSGGESESPDVGADTGSSDGLGTPVEFSMMDVGAATKEPEVQVYLSFADNANFINGYAAGVVWGSRSATPPPSSSASSAPAYVVGLRITHDGPNFCSGTLVASGYVLTAAHCVSDSLANFVVVSGGASGQEVIPVVLDTVQIHPSFGSPFQYSNDAAVLELASPASSYGVALDLSIDYAATTRATMFGFGVRSSADLDKPAAVRAIDGMPLYTRAQCAATLPDIDGSMLCAGGEKGKDACQGDSGGPLIVRNAQGRDVLAGIVSAGYGCGLEGVPGVYARVSSLVDFVDSYAVGFQTVKTSTTGMDASTALPTSRSGASANESRSAVDAADIESYSGNSSGAGHSISSHGNSSQGAGFEKALVPTPIPANLREPVRVALMSFLLGDWYSFVEDPASGLIPLADPANQLTLRSRGDAAAILASLRRHEAKPLNNRKDRFQRGTSVKGLWEAAVDASSANACNGPRT